MDQLHFSIFPQSIHQRVHAKEFIQRVQISQTHARKTLGLLQRGQVGRGYWSFSSTSRPRFSANHLGNWPAILLRPIGLSSIGYGWKATLVSKAMIPLLLGFCCLTYSSQSVSPTRCSNLSRSASSATTSGWPKIKPFCEG